MFLNQRKIHHTTFTTLFSVLLLLISSCTVKNVIADALGGEYNKPLNPSKTGTGATCHFEASQKGLIEYSCKKSVETQPEKITPRFLFRGYSTTKNIVKLPFSFTFKIPRYILYKKIKYHIC